MTLWCVAHDTAVVIRPQPGNKRIDQATQQTGELLSPFMLHPSSVTYYVQHKIKLLQPSQEAKRNKDRNIYHQTINGALATALYCQSLNVFKIIPNHFKIQCLQWERLVTSRRYSRKLPILNKCSDRVMLPEIPNNWRATSQSPQTSLNMLNA